ncbi:MAG: RNA polymerase sigma factor [Candidatus Pacebacteria bacterium]|jgi:RNA polymerase sigma-70 factor (ECF subfamily)|nr:RNA polymerase sigma factor [Candidatus Paceibacterota bacterium]
MTDQELAHLITGVKNGNPEAHRQLFDMLAPKLYAFVRYRVPDYETAEDIVQDGLVALFRALDTFVVQSTGQFYQYVYTIMRRQLAQYYGNKHSKAALVQVDTDEATWVAAADDYSTTGDVARALATLDPITRDVVVLHHWSRYTFGEIALMLGLEEGAVRTRHHRAKAALATLLA